MKKVWLRRIAPAAVVLSFCLTAAAQAEKSDAEHPADTGSHSALKTVGTTENKIVKDTPAPKRLSRKERINRDFYGFDEEQRKVKLRYPGKAKAGEDVPDWSLVSLKKLSDYQLLLPTEIDELLSEPSRELMAKLITRAYHENSEQQGSHYFDAQFELEKLMLEYDTELRNLGYEAGRYAAFGHVPEARRTRVRGELRYNYVNHSGDPKFDSFDSRVRARIYVDQPLDDNWMLYGMGEANKSWFRNIKHFRLERLYVQGKYKDVQLTGGRYGVFYGDGNIYDGRLDGVRVSGGEKVRLSADYGKLRGGEKVAAVMADYDEPKYDVSAGLYFFDKFKGHGSNTIGEFGAMYYLGNYGLGAMYLVSSRSAAGGTSGYVLTVQYGRLRSWIPGTYEIFAKYYNQPEMTYIGHTMVGLADYMEGFKGFGAGMYYTLAENLIYAIEYYDLEEKSSGRKGRTLWNHISYFF